MRRPLFLIPLVIWLMSCVPNEPYRASATACEAANCDKSSIEVHALNTIPASEYLLGIVEFDDQGNKQLPAQMDAVFSRMKAESVDQDLCIIMFVHGWKHNAAADDTNMVDFHKLLDAIARTEQVRAHGAWDRPRKVFGIYAGWRGQSLDAGIVTDLTFWNRKDAAQRVALGSIRELLGRARALRDTIDRTTWSHHVLPPGAKPPPGDQLRSTRLLTIGHSFGGLIVYTALAQYFTDRAAAAMTSPEFGGTGDDDKRIPSYGDLVVIVNPAVEAVSWEPIRQIVQDKHQPDFAKNQSPVFVQITSSADDATGTAFPLGRSLDTFTESFKSSDERREALYAVGHYQPFWTHDLTSTPNKITVEQAETKRVALAQASPVAATAAAGAVVAQECRDNARFEAHFRHSGYLPPGWSRTYASGAILTHRGISRFDANDPFWMVHADASVIASHGDIQEPVFVDFIRELYDDLLLDTDACRSPQ